jgi:hypothetical protein
MHVPMLKREPKMVLIADFETKQAGSLISEDN